MVAQHTLRSSENNNITHSGSGRLSSLSERVPQHTLATLEGKTIKSCNARNNALGWPPDSHWQIICHEFIGGWRAGLACVFLYARDVCFCVYKCATATAKVALVGPLAGGDDVDVAVLGARCDVCFVIEVVVVGCVAREDVRREDARQRLLGFVATRIGCVLLHFNMLGVQPQQTQRVLLRDYATRTHIAHIKTYSIYIYIISHVGAYNTSTTHSFVGMLA